MRNIYIYISLIGIMVSLLPIQSNAQYEHGSMMIGGNATASKRNYKDPDELENRTFGFRINSNISFFVSDKTAIGGGFLYSYGSGTYQIGSKNETLSRGYSFGIGPMIRTYISTPLFLDFSFERRFSSSHTTFLVEDRSGDLRTEDSEPLISSRWDIQFGIGYNHFLNESVALEAIIRYDYGSFPGEECCNSKYHSVQLALGAQVFLHR